MVSNTAVGAHADASPKTGLFRRFTACRETDSAEYDERTEQNVLDSDATLIVAREKELSGGTAFTKTCAEQHGRPLLVVCERDGLSQGAAALSKFLKQNKVRTLNVAGPRESQAPGLGKFVRELLEAALTAKLAP